MDNEQNIAENEVEFADNVNDTEEVANPQENEVDNQSEVQAEDNELPNPETDNSKNEEKKEVKNETKRVSERIKEVQDKAKKEALESHKGVKLLERLAKKRNMSVEEYVDLVEEQEEMARIKEMAASKGIQDDGFAKEFYDMKKKAEGFEKMMQENQSKEQEKAKSKKEFEDFSNFYKSEYGADVNIEDIPNGVFDLQAKGKSLIDAFVTYKFKEMRKGQVVKNKNQENSENSTGSVSSSGTNETIFTPENINKMSSKEISKHWSNPEFRKAAGLD